jgi:hypothetical protein
MQMASGSSTMSSINSCKTYIQLWFCSQRHISNHIRGSLFQIITFIKLTASREGGTAVAVRKGSLCNQVDLSPLISTEATGVCKPTGHSEVLLLAVFKSPGHAWNDADITELLNFRHKSLPEGDFNAEHLFWNRVVFHPSGAKLQNLLHIVTFFWLCDYRRGMDELMNLLTTCIHHSELHFIDRYTQTNVLSLLQSPLAVSWQRLLPREILQLPAVRSSSHGRPCRTASQLTTQLSPLHTSLLVFSSQDIN